MEIPGVGNVGLGYVHEYDIRNKNYPMRLKLDPARDQFFPKGIPEGVAHVRTGPVLGQGNTGTCVGHGIYGKCQDSPIMQTPKQSPFDLYRMFVLEDPWSDNDHEATAPNDELQGGTSVLTACNVTRRLGYFENFLHAESVEDVRAWHLARFGGVIFGTIWKTAMFTPDSEGFIKFEGADEGGHCYISKGWNDRVRHNGRNVRACRIKNSWTTAWGQGGFAWIEYDELAKALEKWADAVAVLEHKITPLKVA